MMDQAVVRMDQLFQEALSAGRLRADASLVLEPEVVEEEELEAEEEAPIEGEVDPNIEAPAVQSLEEVVRSIAPEPAPQRDPAPPAPAQPPRP